MVDFIVRFNNKNREGCIEGSSRRIMDLFIYVMFKFFVIVNSFIFSL